MKNTDKLVLELLDKVEKKKQEIGKCERPQWITNCTFSFLDTNKTINIQTADKETLAFIAGYLKWWEIACVAGAELVGVAAKFKYLGFKIEEWIADLTTRANQIQIKSKRDELADLEKRVNALVTPEQRREIELAKLVEELK